MKKISLYTFGKQKIHIHLAEELNRADDERYVRIVGNILTKTHETLNCVKKDINIKQRTLFYCLIKEKVLKTINASIVLKDEQIISFLKNAVNIILKTYLKQKV